MKVRHLAWVLFLSAVSLEGREWTSSDGRKVQAELVSVLGEEGSETVVLKNASGKQFTLPIGSLSAEDQTFAKEQRQSLEKDDAEEKEASSSSSNDKEDGIFAKLQGKLVAVNGKRVSKFTSENKPKYYAFYYSASWCGPCRKFTPSLVEFYEKSKKAGTEFEIVLVSSDQDEASMEEYMKESKMPWPAISFRQLSRLKDIRSLSTKGIPSLVLVDSDGKVLSHSYVDGNYVGPNKVLRDLEKLL